MKLKFSVHDSPEAKGNRAAAVSHFLIGYVQGDMGEAFVRECYERMSSDIFRLTKEAITLGLDEEGKREWEYRRQSWTNWFRKIHNTVVSIDESRSYDLHAAFLAISWLESELHGFGETLRKTKGQTESEISQISRKTLE